MIATLIKKQLSEVFKGYFYNQKNNTARSKASSVILIILFLFLVVGVLGGTFAFLSYSICEALVKAEAGWLYFAILGGISVFLGTFGSVFNTYASLYLAKDNDFLLSMPIPVKYIIISRLLNVYILGTFYSAIVFAPAVIIYLITVGFGIKVLLGGIIMLIVISALVLCLTCLLGWVLAKLSKLSKNKNYVTVIAALLGIGLYYYIYYNFQNMISDIIANAVIYGTAIKKNALFVYYFGNVGTGDLLSLLIGLAISAVLVAAVCGIISKSFLKIVTSSGVVYNTSNKKIQLKSKSESKTLLAKELSRFVSSPNYMLNCGLGIVFMPIAGIAAVIFSNKLETLFEMMGNYLPSLPVFAVAAICLVMSINDMASVSVSLEGKSIWIVQSLPVSGWNVLKAKIEMQIILTSLPALIASVCLAAVIPSGIIEKLSIVVIVQLFVVLFALKDIYFGLKMPNIHWTNEIIPIKQNIGVLLSIFTGFGIAAVTGLLYFIVSGFISASVYFLILFIIISAVIILLYRWTKENGSRIFENLS